MMKILFVDHSADMQQRWIDPLRNEGWGVIRARSAEDASRMLFFHGKSLDYVVVYEKDVVWAEKQGNPFILINRDWTDSEVLKHQNSNHAAVGYLKAKCTAKDIKNLVDSRNKKVELKENASRLELENFADVLSKPEPTKTSIESSIRLDGPSVYLGGESTNTDLRRNLESIGVHELTNKSQTQDAVEKTVIIEETRLELNEISLDEVEEVQGIEINEEEIEFSESLDQAVGSSYYEPTPAVNPSRVNVPSPPPRTQPINEAPPEDRAPYSADVETMKNYLSLREQDVAMLTGQLRSSQERIHHLEVQLKVEKARSTELQHIAQKQEQQIKNYDQDKLVETEVLFKQVEDLNLQLRERTDKVRTIETKLKHTTIEVDKVKERVRVDIRRIRVREKELEGQLEVLKKDSSALLLARDEKIIELKRKIDLLEFNMELVQEQFTKERNVSDQLRLRLKDAASVMRQAGGLLDHEN